MTDFAASPNAHLDRLDPPILWKHFRFLCDTPRPSGSETAVIDGIAQWAVARGLETVKDAVGNLLVRKAATPGHEQAPGIVLQGHVDMVAQAAVPHDFQRDPIETEVRDGWLHAKGTTLGADNGIGVAAALAVLEDDTLVHGPLEALFTIGEEVSMEGALALDPEWLNGRYLLNMDAEEWGSVYVGCAGGVHVLLDESLPVLPRKEALRTVQLAVSGLKGGHSGIDIGLQRGNAHVLLARALLAVRESVDELRLVAIEGGTMSNAIPRDAIATIAVPADQVERVAKTLDGLQQVVRAEWAHSDPDATLSLNEAAQPESNALSAEASATLIDLLNALPYGVARWSDELEGVVETSNNIGKLRLAEGQLTLDAMTRSLCDSAALALVARIKAVCRLAGFSPATSNVYPGWTPALKSVLLEQFQQQHDTVLGRPADVRVIHAGLECGLIGAKYPDMDMVAFGPTIRGAHSPDERVDLATVAAFWQLVRGLVERIGRTTPAAR
ncbi:aminoacyl-histidine dipeptidase [Zymobacter palmae]|uniref:Cytosol non-specific dipeptidase n=1 Tax=Zymobacter palmae TaxID=33074 RepID=A0A348HDC4_9GAMM|nr:aminoacyl-histidine dipeptidase [Zymobacter palmae]BBG29626.1 di- and tripeptidases [Zymobacter palmae]